MVKSVWLQVSLTAQELINYLIIYLCNQHYLQLWVYRVLIAPRVGRGHANVVFVHVRTQEECRGTDKCEGDKVGLGIDYL